MTTAHRPTWNPRKGNGDNIENPSLQFSARDLPSNTIIKYRKDGQGSKNDLENVLNLLKIIVFLRKNGTIYFY